MSKVVDWILDRLLPDQKRRHKSETTLPALPQDTKAKADSKDDASLEEPRGTRYR